MGCAENKAVQVSNVLKPSKESRISAKAFKSETKTYETMVLGTYKVIFGRSCILGEGTSSSCYRGINTKNGQQVAIKMYKTDGEAKQVSNASVGNKVTSTLDVRYRRQIEVLMYLQEPFHLDAFAGKGRTQICSKDPTNFFVQLLDFSPYDVLEKYIVTEVGQLTLKSLLRKHFVAQHALQKERIGEIAQSIVLAIGGLHEKGLVHLDIKPENFMLFRDHWKLIDVDGCTPIGEHVSLQDNTVSFSPCYCAPEWARFVTSQEKNTTICVDTPLDSWSVGMTLAELIILEAPLKSQFKQIADDTEPHNQKFVMKRFLRYVGQLEAVCMPDRIVNFSKEFSDMIKYGFLELTPSKRLKMIDCLEGDFMQNFTHMSASVNLDRNVPLETRSSDLPDVKLTTRNLRAQNPTPSLSQATTECASPPTSTAYTPMDSPTQSPRVTPVASAQLIQL